MDCFQDMSDRQLKNLKRNATINLLLGADNNKVIDAIDDELERRKKLNEF